MLTLREHLGLCVLYEPCLPFASTWDYVSYTSHAYPSRAPGIMCLIRAMLTLREHLGLAPVFGGVHVAHLVSFLCCVVFLLFLSSSCVYMFKQIITLKQIQNCMKSPKIQHQNRMKRQNRYPRTKRHDHSLFPG